VPVGQVHVEQDQVDRLAAEHPRCLLERLGDRHDLELTHPFDVRPVGLRRDRLVLDDQHPDGHDPILTSKAAPPSSLSRIVASPP
jgi:hypothetical protein